MSTLKKIVNFTQKVFKFYQDTQKDSLDFPQRTTNSAPASTSPKRASSSRTASSAPTDDYPGDYKGTVNFQYAPENDGEPDPGEIVWAWVPYQEDYSQGKDRPVLIVGKHGRYYLTLMLTSKDHTNSSHHDDRYLDIGSGNWDKSDRPSEINLGRVIQIAEDKIRREGAVLDENTFNQVKLAFQKHNQG